MNLLLKYNRLASRENFNESVRITNTCNAMYTSSLVPTCIKSVSWNSILCHYVLDNINIDVILKD